jgi:Zn-dependent protease
LVFEHEWLQEIYFMTDLIQTISIFALPVVFAITFHEAAHGYVARLFGDPTATLAGRVTLNPIPHIDPVGTILVPLGMLLTSKLLGGPPLLFGWAKPVPVDFGRLRRPKQDMLWVALAGPAANMLMAVIWAITIRFVLDAGLGRDSFLFQVAAVGIQINLVLMALNLFPLLPLDGGRILFSLLPHQLAWQYGRLEPYGMVILIVLLLTGSLWVLIEPFMALGRWIVRLFL